MWDKVGNLMSRQDLNISKMETFSYDNLYRLTQANVAGGTNLTVAYNAIGNITKNSIASIPECLRFSWSHDVDTLVSGVQTVEELEQNVLACKTFKPMSRKEKEVILARTKDGPHGSKVESYKKPEAGARRRLHHDGEPA